MIAKYVERLLDSDCTSHLEGPAMNVLQWLYDAH